jgi:hypothetical protein
VHARVLQHPAERLDRRPANEPGRGADGATDANHARLRHIRRRGALRPQPEVTDKSLHLQDLRAARIELRPRLCDAERNAPVFSTDRTPSTVLPGQTPNASTEPLPVHW